MNTSKNTTKVEREPRPDMQVPKILLTMQEASWATGIPERTLRQKISRGEIPIVLNGTRPLIRRESLEKYAEENEIYRNRTKSDGPEAKKTAAHTPEEQAPVFIDENEGK